MAFTVHEPQTNRVMLIAVSWEASVEIFLVLVKHSDSTVGPTVVYVF